MARRPDRKGTPTLIFTVLPDHFRWRVIRKLNGLLSPENRLSSLSFNQVPHVLFLTLCFCPLLFSPSLSRQSVMNMMHVISIPYALMKVNPLSWIQKVCQYKGNVNGPFTPWLWDMGFLSYNVWCVCFKVLLHRTFYVIGLFLQHFCKLMFSTSFSWNTLSLSNSNTEFKLLFLVI